MHTQDALPLNRSAARAARVLENGGTVSEAARAAGVSRPTIYSWIKRDFRFSQHTLASRDAAYLSKSSESTLLARLAVGAIAQILSNDQLPASVRARVALAVLERGSIDKSNWSYPEYFLESDTAETQRALSALVAHARKLYILTPELDTGLTPQPTDSEAKTPKPESVKSEQKPLSTAA